MLFCDLVFKSNPTPDPNPSLWNLDFIFGHYLGLDEDLVWIVV